MQVLLVLALIGFALCFTWNARGEEKDRRYLSLNLCAKGVLLDRKISCGMRTFPVPLSSPELCLRFSAHVILLQPQAPEGSYWRLPAICTRQKPGYPEVPGLVQPGRFA